MQNLSPCSMTDTGTYEPEKGELTLVSTDHTNLLTHDKQPTNYTDGLLTITTHRLIWTSSDRKQSISCKLSNIHEAKGKTKAFSQYARISIEYKGSEGIKIETSKSRGDVDTIVKTIHESIRRKEWERIEREEKEKEELKLKEQQEINNHTYGVGGITAIQNKIQIKDQQRNQVIHSGFQSLDQLRSQASHLITIASRCKYLLEKQTKDNNEDNDDLLNLIQEIGIQSPVLKSVTGNNMNLYIEQLSRQLYEFLKIPLLNLGGIITLSDAYCLVNRNRATTELISPNDFRHAINYFVHLNNNSCSIRSIQLESGIDALQYEIHDKDNKDIEKIGLNLQKLAQDKTSISAFDVMRQRRIPIQRAKHLLLQVESIGLLVRDESIYGLRFFPNLFHDYV